MNGDKAIRRLAATFTGMPGKTRAAWASFRFRDVEPYETDDEFIASTAHLLPPAALAGPPASAAGPGCACPLPYCPGGEVPCVAAGRCMRRRP